MYNIPANFTCPVGGDTPERVVWFANATPTSNTELVLNVDSVQRQGYYTCLALSTFSIIATFRIFPERRFSDIRLVFTQSCWFKGALVWGGTCRCHQNQGRAQDG